MERDSVRKTFKYRLKPTPAQERALAVVLWRCRELYNAGLEERKAAWEKCGVSVTFALQSAQLPGLKEVRPEYRDLNAQVLQDVLHRLDKAYQAFFRRVAAGERQGIRASRAATATAASPIRRRGSTAARGWTTASWCCRRSGGSRCAGRAHWKGTPKTVTDLA